MTPDDSIVAIIDHQLELLVEFERGEELRLVALGLPVRPNPHIRALFHELVALREAAVSVIAGVSNRDDPEAST